MKQKTFTRITSFILAVCIIVFTSFSCTFPVYASDNSHGGGGGSNHESSTSADDIITNTKKWSNFICCFFADAGALFVDFDFAKMAQNNAALHDLWNDEHVSIENDSITVDSEITDLLKKLLEEYQKEKFGYKILRTVNYRDIPATAFGNSYSYKTMCNLVKKYKLINISMTPYGIGLKNMEHYLDGSSGFYVHNYYSSSHNYEMFLMDYNNWTLPGADSYYFYGLDKELFSWEDVESYFKDNPKSPDGTYKNSSSVDTYSRSYVRDLGYPFDKSYSVNWLVSDTGSDVLVFNSATALKNYSVDKRNVFTTKKFYEDTGSVTVDLSKLEDEVSDINTALDKLLKQLNDKMTESDIEDLLQKILDELKNNSSSGDSGNTGGNTGGSTGGDSSGGGSVDLSGLSGYFETIISYLDSILNMQILSYETESQKEQFKTDTEKFINDNSMSFMEIANTFGKKFPFCIPSDLSHLFAKLTGTSDVATQALLDDDTDYLMSVAYSGNDGDISVYSDDSIAVYADDNETDSPYFEIPIVIKSFDIHYNIVVDMKPFKAISVFSRSLFAVLFAVGLIKITLSIIPIISYATD